LIGQDVDIKHCSFAAESARGSLWLSCWRFIPINGFASYDITVFARKARRSTYSRGTPAQRLVSEIFTPLEDLLFNQLIEIGFL
jgi:hypothetical protein